MRKASILIAAACAVAAWTSVHAALHNPSFETGNLSDWFATQPVSVQTSSFGITPTEGSFQAVLRSNGESTSRPSLEQFFGLPSGSLGAGDYVGGSGIMQTITLYVPGTIWFDWNFLTVDELDDVPPDFAFMTLYPASGPGSFTLLADDGDATLASGAQLYQDSTLTPASQTGWQTYESGLLAAGDYVLGIGVLSFDVNDTSRISFQESAVLVDNVRGTGVPDAGSCALMLCFALMSLGGFGRWLRRHDG